ncbi:MAG: histidine kinase [Flammeovirgaceae bacterium]|nr:histidine kinase [Flammeovirgaceae bacterium]
MRFINTLIYSNQTGIRILRHTLFWIVDIFNWLVVVSLNKEITFRELYFVLLTIPLAIITSYFIMYYLLPRFSNDQPKAKLFLMVLGVLVLLGVVLRIYKVYFVFPLLDGVEPGAPDLLSLGRIISEVFYWLGVICMAVAIKLIKSKTELQQKNEQLLSEKRVAELSFLKLQMHPHFLFNTLNTLYSETIQNTEKAGMVVMHLSNLLRFILEECNKPMISLEKEIKVIKDYIELEKLRHGTRLNVNLQVPESNNGILLSPLLFLPFVENSFKHSLSHVRGPVTIDIQIGLTDDSLHLMVENDRTRNHIINGFPSGKGITNIKRQLELLYGKGHHLTISESEKKYRIELTIPSKNNLIHG